MTWQFVKQRTINLFVLAEDGGFRQARDSRSDDFKRFVYVVFCASTEVYHDLRPIRLSIMSANRTNNKEVAVKVGNTKVLSVRF